MKPKKPLPNKKNKLKSGTNIYVLYSGMAFKMAAVMLIGILAGKKLDAYFETEPILTAVFALLATFAALYVALKDVLLPKK